MEHKSEEGCACICVGGGGRVGVCTRTRIKSFEWLIFTFKLYGPIIFQFSKDGGKHPKSENNSIMLTVESSLW